MSFVTVMLLRPILFALAIVGAVVTGEHEQSAWIGLLAFFIASGLARTNRRALRGRPRGAVRAFLWPVFAAGFVVLYHWAGLPTWAAVVLAFVSAGIAKNVLAAALFAPGSGRRLDAWGIPGPDDVVEGRWTESS
jgi:hypothetical protein